jgi:uncharacterized membrane protein
MRISIQAFLIALIVGGLAASPAAAQEARVHVVLFYSPTCGHCQQLIQNDLPPILEKYGSQLEILAIDVSQPAGQELYIAAIERFSIPEARRGVPAMIVGDVVLVGGFEIPEQFPGLVDAALAGGGLGWPDFPGLEETLAGMQPAPGATPTPIPHALPAPEANLLQADPVGFILALIVLLALLAVLPIAWLTFRRSRASAPPRTLLYIFPLLALSGSLVAIYLLSVESSGSLAVCGPIGDCNAVQQSAYARLFGQVPIAALGLLLQLALLVLFVACSALRGAAGRVAALLLLALAIAGVFFSIYLTALELFVIGAVCAWCLTSALIVAGEAWLAARIAGSKTPAPATLAAGL